MKPTPVFESYWRFASERHAMFERRLRNPKGPWTSDAILNTYRFTNSFRAADRVSQYLIGEVQLGIGRPQSPEELFFRTMLFKLFNKIETWEALADEMGEFTSETFDYELAGHVLDRLREQGDTIYSAAYIMPSPPYGHARKHRNHLALLGKMMEARLPSRIAQLPNLKDVFEGLLAWPGLGRFLAFQFTIDLNYSAITR
ncbi:MAG: nucleotide kinase domain-containing protein, partial [Henriciella sp.]|uniref:nucleotide kinase domain-containing protein n=1 Tax=Henriciella sp. TaxID=1968823 RepID=UPI003C77936F